MGVLDTEAWGRRPSLFEYWGHVASFMPVEWQPLFRWRMQQGRDESRRRKSGLSEFARERRAYIDEVLAEITRRGPVTAAISRRRARASPAGGNGPRARWRWSGCSAPA